MAGDDKHDLLSEILDISDDSPYKSSCTIHKQAFQDPLPSPRVERQSDELPSVIPLNVGGYRFMTRLSTLRKYPDSMLAAMFSGRHKLDMDSNGYYFIDSNGKYFHYILDYLRHDEMPPAEVTKPVYKEAMYYNLHTLVDALQTTPAIAFAVVKESHRAQFPDYKELKRKVIRIGIDNAAVSKQGEVVLHVFRKPFVPRAASFSLTHDCVADTAHVSIGPWEAVADEDALVKCLEADLMQDGFMIRPHEQRKRCKYYSGQNCQKCVYKITFLFQQ